MRPARARARIRCGLASASNQSALPFLRPASDCSPHLSRLSPVSLLFLLNRQVDLSNPLILWGAEPQVLHSRPQRTRNLNTNFNCFPSPPSSSSSQDQSSAGQEWGCRWVQWMKFRGRWEALTARGRPPERIFLRGLPSPCPAGHPFCDILICNYLHLERHFANKHKTVLLSVNKHCIF